jgi:hypothetical protein
MTTAAVYAIVITATAIYVASAVSAVLDIAVTFTVTTAIFTVSAAIVIVTTTVFTATTAVSVYSASASDRSPHSVSSVRPRSYHPLAPFPQSVMNT